MNTPLAFLLDPSVKHQRVEAAVTKLWSARERATYGICLAFHRLCRDGVHRGRGRARFEDWAEQRFGVRAKLARTFQWIGSRLEELPLTLAAMESGALTYTKLREFLKVVTPETEAEWIEFARTHTNRQIEARVVQKTRDDGTETTKVTSELTPEERQAMRKAREVLQKTTGKSIRPTKLLGEMARTIAENGLFGSGPDAAAAPGQDQDQDHGHDQAAQDGRKKSTAYVSFQPCPICLDTFVPVPEGLMRVPAGEWAEAIREGAENFDLTSHFFCDCEGTKHRKDRCPNWTLPEAPPATNRHIPAAVSHRMRARDGFVCRTPGCRCEVPLETSHLIPYRDGTPPTLENLRQHCATCNDLIETGRLRVLGGAPYERYYASNGEFLGFGYSRSDPHVGTGTGPAGDAATGSPEPPTPALIGSDRT